MINRIFLAPMAAVALVGIAQAQSPAPPITMIEDSGKYTLTWRGAAGKAVIRYRLFANEGQIYVCGNYAISGHSNTRLTREALREKEIRMDERVTLLADFTNFNRIRSESRLVGSQANCFASGVAAPKNPRQHTFGVFSTKSTFRD